VSIPRNRFASFKFCSRKCGWEWKKIHQQVSKTCHICSKSFSVISVRDKTAKYCSRECYYRSLAGRGFTEYFCRHCGKSFRDAASRNRIYCSRSCINKAQLGTWSPAFTTIRKALHSRGKIAACERCGYDKIPEILGVHHKDENRKNNDISNLEVLCANCHSEAHMKHIAHASGVPKKAAPG
jgi:hypothetical protein